MSHPMIIQGGMGAAVSNWRLARAVSQAGQLGVVSGTALGAVLARRLQLGDPGGHMRRALAHFPFANMAARILDAHFIPDGKPAGTPFKLTAMPTLRPGKSQEELTVAANFAEVYLAKEGHHGWVGINFLEKIQLPTLPSLYGAMLAGVDYVLMGAGIPRSIPGVMDRLANGEPVDLKIDVEGGTSDEEFRSRFDPRAFCEGMAATVGRPLFVGIVASATLAMTLAKKSSGRVDGFVVEGETAGGHNAPPRGPLRLSARGEPIYGPRDVPELDKIRDLGLPFWLAGSYGRECRLADALLVGATGIQVGTAFAFCDESGIAPHLKARALQMSREGRAGVFTDPVASPTGFPFKVVQMPGTLSEAEDYASRTRVCDLGFLRHVYRKPDGTVGYRCSAEPIEDFVKKGGSLSETHGRKCLCNGLMANVGLGQLTATQGFEKALLTAGDDVAEIARFLTPNRDSYGARDVIQRLLAENEAARDFQPAPDTCVNQPALVSAGV
jgi:nitronate monooxygenase